MQTTPESLPTTYVNAGMEFHLLERRGDAALFAYFDPQNKLHNFEVHKVRVEKACFALGKQWPAREALARSSQWGKYGWTYTDLLSAGVRFTSLAV